MTTRSLSRARVLAPDEAVDVRPYDFTSPELLTDLQRQLLHAAFESFAQSCGVQITAQTRIVARVDFDTFALVPFGALPERLGAGGGHVLCAVDGSRAPLVYRVPLEEALLWAARMVGGTGRIETGSRPLTAIERALIWRMADETLHELGVALGELLPPIAVSSFGYDLSSAAPADELMMLATFRMERDGVATALAIAVPAAPVLAAFGHGLAPQPHDAVVGMLQRQISASPVEVALRFDDTRVSYQAVLHLAEGDVIALAHPRHRPLALVVDGSEISRAAVGANGGRLACVVVDYQEAS